MIHGLSHGRYAANRQGSGRLRMGSYRLICSVDLENKTVLVLRIGHRREVYD